MKVNDIVQFKYPLADEIGVTYKVIEVNGDRVIMEAQIGLAFNPQYVAMVKDLEVIK